MVDIIFLEYIMPHIHVCVFFVFVFFFRGHECACVAATNKVALKKKNRRNRIALRRSWEVRQKVKRHSVLPMMLLLCVAVVVV